MPEISADNNKRSGNTTPSSISNILKLGSRLSFVIVYSNPVRHKISGDYVVEFTLLFRHHRFLQFRLEMLQASSLAQHTKAHCFRTAAYHLVTVTDWCPTIGSEKFFRYTTSLKTRSSTSLCSMPKWDSCLQYSHNSNNLLVLAKAQCWFSEDTYAWPELTEEQRVSQTAFYICTISPVFVLRTLRISSYYRQCPRSENTDDLGCCWSECRHSSTDDCG